MNESMIATGIDTSALDLLRVELPGRVWTADDEGYDVARAGFSLLDQPAPAVVVAVRNSADVIAAVRFAKEQHLPIGVKATGHGFGFPYQGGLMINTEQMQGVEIDPQHRIARVEAGVIWRSVVDAAHVHGLAPLNGSAPHVGVVGYSLFGGLGWLLRKYGAAVDSVTAIEVVTADGQFRRVSEESDADLFWAMRGASGNFGVVTAIEFKLYPVSEVYGGALFFPMEQAEAVLTAYSHWVETVPEDVTSSVVLFRLPPLPELPPFLSGRAVITIRAAFVGSESEGARLLEPLRALDGIIIDTFAMMPYTQIGTINNDPLHPMPSWRKTMMLKDLGADTVKTILDVGGIDSVTPVMMVEIRQLGGAMTRVPADATSYSQRYAPFVLQAMDLVMAPEHAVRVKHNIDAISDAVQPHTTGGVLPGWLGDGDHGTERMRAGFTAAHYERLVTLKDRYDPTNLFRLNQNIPPSTQQTR